MDEIRIGVAGLGPRAVGTWIPMLQRIPGFRVTALCDPIAPLLDRARAQLSFPSSVRTYQAYDELLGDPRVDAIALTVRTARQGDLAAIALEAGKHVHAEVPAAHAIEDCWRIVLAVERTGRIYQLAEQTRYWGFVEAWRSLVASGRLGRITLCEGQYFHHYVAGMFQDPHTGDLLGPAALAAHPDARPTWAQLMPPIHYLPHELSPMLRVLDDRVTQVVAMSTDAPSAAHPALAQPDMQVALMRTRKGTLLRMAASFAQPHPDGNWHWYQVLGTGGRVEWSRGAGDRPKLWLADEQLADLADADWRYERTDAPSEARGSGHGDADYYTHVAFRDAVLAGRQPEFDVYQAMDTAAPAVLAAESIARGSELLTVPDFRPHPGRQEGEGP
ncbi:Gfo/Idh/MocA family oxidoreductase [Actinopolymorpha sp. B17G11]|uniref:Gfo/Idh/MocA family protein n=1 Tax=Actinopolymorpha sp. B17G11 TaxID=3160861 RepID=UPI0032E3DC84